MTMRPILPLIGKDGNDIINTVTCALMGTESISEHRVYTGNRALNRIYQLKSLTKTALVYNLTLLNPHLLKKSFNDDLSNRESTNSRRRFIESLFASMI